MLDNGAFLHGVIVSVLAPICFGLFPAQNENKAVKSYYEPLLTSIYEHEIVFIQTLPFSKLFVSLFHRTAPDGLQAHESSATLIKCINHCSWH